MGLPTVVFTGFARTAAELPRFVVQIGAEVAQALENGTVTPEEAEAMARRLSSQRGDLLRVRVKGTDVVDQSVQDNLAAAFGRLAANIVQAVKSAPTPNS